MRALYKDIHKLTKELKEKSNLIEKQQCDPDELRLFDTL